MRDIEVSGGGRAVRLNRLFRRGDGRLFVLPLDHSVSDGPIAAASATDRLVGVASAGGADAVVLPRGRVRSVAPSRWRDLSLVVHLSASTRHAADPSAKVLVASVESALCLGADAVSVHVNVGSSTEKEQLRDLGVVASACDRWGVPLLAMMYARGPNLDGRAGTGTVAHLATLAADLGADLVKVPYAGSAATMTEVVLSCPIPVLVAGGPRDGSRRRLLARVAAIMDAGACGIAMGRNVFEASDPLAAASSLSRLVHADAVRRARPAVGASS